LEGQKLRLPARSALALATAALALSLATVGLSCGDSEPPVAARAGEVVISQPYALNAPLADSLPVYLTVINQGDKTDALVGASSPAGGDVLLVLGGERSPVSPDVPLAVPAGEEVKLTPEGDHLLLLDALPRLSDGDVFSLELTFAIAGSMEVPVPVVTPRD